MRLVTHKRRRGGFLPARDRKDDVRGTLPSFIRPLGLDFIITPDDRCVLVELQHGFGRRGLVHLFPSANRTYRKTLWALRRERGKSPWIVEGLRKICSDKITTYRRFSSYQPSSFVYRKWGPRVEQWLDGLSSRHVLAKPPRGSCGKGILVLDREEFRRSRGVVSLGNANLLQEYVPSRSLMDAQGHAHMGCIRHILLISSDGVGLKIIHTPSYWRVSPTLFDSLNIEDEALTANISRGAIPQALSARDTLIVQDMSETICQDLICQILELPPMTMYPSESIVD